VDVEVFFSHLIVRPFVFISLHFPVVKVGSVFELERFCEITLCFVLN